METSSPTLRTFDAPGLASDAQVQAAPSRALSAIQTMTGGSLVLVALILILQWLAPAGAKPSDVIGQFHGGVETSTADSSRLAQMRTAEGLSNSQAMPQSNWAIEQWLAQKQLEERGNGMGVEVGAANMADLACIAGNVLPMLFGHDTDQTAGGLRQACGVGAEIRQNVNNELSNAVRTGSGVMQRATPEGGLPPNPEPQ